MSQMTVVDYSELVTETSKISTPLRVTEVEVHFPRGASHMIWRDQSFSRTRSGYVITTDIFT